MTGGGLFAGALFAAMLFATPVRAERWVASWTGAAQGPYPLAHAYAQPDLSLAIPDFRRGAVSQTMRMMVKPGVWGNAARIRLSNAYGMQAVTFTDIYVGLQASGGSVVSGTARRALFNSAESVTIPPGATAVSDPVELDFVTPSSVELLDGRRLAVSFHIPAESGPMTFHGSAMTTSYLSPPRSASVAASGGDAGLPFATTSWFFLDRVDMRLESPREVIVALGDSLTDGITTTLNGDDRWPDVLARRLQEAAKNRFVVVNQGIVGNQILGPRDYRALPTPGGPSALARIEQDIVAIPGVAIVIWLEGVNDFGDAGASLEDLCAGYRKGVALLREKIPGVRVIAGTLPSALHSPIGTHGSWGVDRRRRALNDWLRKGELFDAVIDFDAVLTDPQTGELHARTQPDSAKGGAGDKLHPNRMGYAAMAGAIPIEPFMKSKQ